MDNPLRRSLIFGSAAGAGALAMAASRGIAKADEVPSTPNTNVQSEISEIHDLIASDVAPFPTAGVDTFLSHFVTAIRFADPSKADELLTFTLDSAVQVVARSKPFIYQGPHVNHQVAIDIPSKYSQEPVISDSSFEVRPAGFFTPGKEHVWVQILDLDSKGPTSIGPVRIIVGETLKREYPDLYLPSLGATQSYGTGGFPARLFFSPVAVIETKFGAFRTRAKVLRAERVTAFPPIGSISITRPVPLDSVEALRAAVRSSGSGTTSRQVEPQIQPVATINALSHPIDAVLHST